MPLEGLALIWLEIGNNEEMKMKVFGEKEGGGEGKK